ncbi:MAG: hypothetical protein V4629_02010 [Pseudomonadota bacterium]
MSDKDSYRRIEPKISSEDDASDYEVPHDELLNVRDSDSYSSTSLSSSQEKFLSRNSVLYMTGILLLLVLGCLWQLSRLQSGLFAAQETISLLSERSTVMESQLTASGAAWNEQQAKVLGQIETSSSGLKTEAQTLKQNIEDIKSQIKKTQNSLGELQTSLNSKIDSLSTQLSTTKNSIENNPLAKNVSQLEINISESKIAVNAMQAQVESANQLIKKFEQDFKLLQINSQENTRSTELLDERFASVSPQLNRLAEQQEQFDQLSQQIESIMLFRKQTNAKLDQLEQQVINIRNTSEMP